MAGLKLCEVSQDFENYKVFREWGNVWEDKQQVVLEKKCEYRYQDADMQWYRNVLEERKSKIVAVWMKQGGNIRMKWVLDKM